MSLWLVILAGGLLTFVMRLSFIYLLGRMDVPVNMRRALRFVPPAVLAALVLPELVMPSGNLDLSPHNYRLLAGLLAVVVARWTKNTIVTILAGIILLLILQFAF